MKAPFCKVCFDTGKPESMYTSHYVNDVPGKKGVVVCPTLLALECRYCKKTGHTVSRCNMITESRKLQFAKKRAERQQQQQQQQNAVEQKPPANRFSALENNEEEIQIQTTKLTPPPSTYASILSSFEKETPPPPPRLRLFEPRSPSTSPPPLPARLEPRSPSTSPPPVYVARKILVWAESFDTDSD